jgi:hypothetical protein
VPRISGRHCSVGLLVWSCCTTSLLRTHRSSQVPVTVLGLTHGLLGCLESPQRMSRSEYRLSAEAAPEAATESEGRDRPAASTSLPPRQHEKNRQLAVWGAEQARHHCSATQGLHARNAARVSRRPARTANRADRPQGTRTTTQTASSLCTQAFTASKLQRRLCVSEITCTVSRFTHQL